MIIDFDAVTEEVLQMLLRLDATLEARHFGYNFSNLLRERFKQQSKESFASEGSPDGGPWVPLSPWRIEARGSSNPILTDSGGLASEVETYHGTVRLISQGFSMWYPDTAEMSGQYWGLTAGQLVNPLGATPLAAFPRRVFGGDTRNTKDSVESLAAYFISEGWEVEIA